MPKLCVCSKSQTVFFVCRIIFDDRNSWIGSIFFPSSDVSLDILLFIFLSSIKRKSYTITLDNLEPTANIKDDRPLFCD